MTWNTPLFFIFKSLSYIRIEPESKIKELLKYTANEKSLA